MYITLILNHTVHDLSYETLIDRYIAKHPTENTPSFISQCKKHLARYNHNVIDKNLEEYEIDKILTKQILHHIRLFFNQSKTFRRHRSRTSTSTTVKNRE